MLRLSRVLLVDDEPAFLRRVAAALTRHGHTVEALPDGLSALRELAAHEAGGTPYDVAVVSLRLPDVDGRKVIAALRERHPGLRVVALAPPAGPGSAADVDPPLADGVLCLTKPVDAGALRAAFVTLGAPEAPHALLAGEAGRACVFVTLARAADPAPAFAALRSLPGVARVDAVRGSADLVLTFEGVATDEDARLLRERVAAIQGVDGVVSRILAAPPGVPHAPPVRGTAVAWVVIEVDRGALPDVLAAVAFLDETVFVGGDVRGAAAVALLAAPDFAALRRVLHDKVRFTAGVLRIEELMVVDMDGQEPTR